MRLDYRLADHGRTFSTRPRAVELRAELLERAGDAETIVVDFDNVLSVSYSFADEFVAHLAQAEGGAGVSWVNASPEVSRVVERAVARRRGDAEDSVAVPTLTYL